MGGDTLYISPESFLKNTSARIGQHVGKITVLGVSRLEGIGGTWFIVNPVGG